MTEEEEKRNRAGERKKREELLDYDLNQMKKHGQLESDEFSFCTPGATSNTLENYVIGKRIG